MNNNYKDMELANSEKSEVSQSTVQFTMNTQVAAMAIFSKNQ